MTDLDREQIDKEPVWYCKNCLSLKIVNLDQHECFCDICGCMDVDTTDINTWNEMYEQKYKHKFIENGRKSTYRWSRDRRE